MTELPGHPGSLPDETLPPSVADAVARQRPLATPVGADIDRVMRQVQVEAARRRRRRFVLAPLGLVAAGAATILILGDGVGAPTFEPESDTHPVEFVVDQPMASGLAVVGDFNAWDVRATPMTRSNDSNRWVVTLQLPAGRYLYAFVADGSRWLPDPAAPLAAPDDFSRRNSVLVVGDPRRSRQ